jgi:hypothetical protein
LGENFLRTPISPGPWTQVPATELFPLGAVANGQGYIESHYPTQAEERLDPDYLYAGPGNGGVCGFH